MRIRIEIPKIEIANELAPFEDRIREAIEEELAEWIVDYPEYAVKLMLYGAGVRLYGGEEKIKKIEEQGWRVEDLQISFENRYDIRISAPNGLTIEASVYHLAPVESEMSKQEWEQYQRHLLFFKRLKEKIEEKIQKEAEEEEEEG